MNEESKTSWKTDCIYCVQLEGLVVACQSMPACTVEKF